MAFKLSGLLYNASSHTSSVSPVYTNISNSKPAA
nr:MAG TPA: hypothetical protein [Caudoviricetes sp.]